MRAFWRTAGLATALVFLLSTPGAEALYKFDDIFGPSGIGGQWMAITGGSDTVGDATSRTEGGVPLDVMGNIVTGRNPLRINNGKSVEALDLADARELRSLFLVIPSNSGTLGVNFSVPKELEGPTGVEPVSTTSDVKTDFEDPDNSWVYNYSSNKEKFTPLITHPGYDGALYRFFFAKTHNSGSYSTVRGNMVFNQNPRQLPSQTLNVPFVIANVYDGTAEGHPLLFRTTLRDIRSGSGANGDIVAYDRFTWDVVDNMRTTNPQWVFVPVDRWPFTQRIDYRLQTEIVNYSGVRYAVQRRDNYAYAHLSPKYWKFDLPNLSRYKDVPQTFQLADDSHIAPGLVTVYDQRFNVNQSEKVPFHLYPVDPARGFRDLTLNHSPIFGIDLGTATATVSGRTPPAYRVTGFRLLEAGVPFLKKVAKLMRAEAVEMPNSRLINTGTVRDDYVTGDTISSFAVDIAVPSSLRRIDKEGLIPLHVTFNIPKSHLLVGEKWDALLKVWHELGDVRDDFASLFTVYLRSGEENDWDLFAELTKRGSYSRIVKVFMDEQREVITVSFIIMLMDGNRDGTRPALGVVTDRGAETENDYVVVRDGEWDNRWKLTAYLTTANYRNSGTRPTPPPVRSESSGGCNTAALGFAGLLAIAPLFLKRKG